MGKTTSRKIIFNRRRFNVRKYLKVKNFLILACSILGILVVTSFVSMQLLKNKVDKSTIKYTADTNEEKNEETNNDNLPVPVNNDFSDNEEGKQDIKNDDNTSIMILGEIMMGGKVTENLDYDYLMAFKDVYEITKKSDFTYANFATNITNLESIEDAKSKYLVTKNISSAFNALGIDSLSLANDHITDFPSDIIKNTENILEENSIFVAGKKDMPVYFEKNGKKVSVISTNSVIIGTKAAYDKSNISIYDKENIKKNIDEAKKMSDFVIVDLHWGKGESSFGVSELMKEMAKFVIDNGADLVMGTHAIGIQPIEIYNGKPIIYTTGYFMTDLEYETTKVSYMFNLNFNKDTKLSTIEMIPIYIKGSKETLLYKNYDEVAANINMKNLCNRNIQNGVTSEIREDRIVVKF